MDETNYPVEVITYGGKKYLVVLSQVSGNDFSIVKAYEYNGRTFDGKIDIGSDRTDFISNNLMANFMF